MDSAPAAQPEFLSRKEAAEYITRKYFKMTAGRLAAYAHLEEGPPYRIFVGKAKYRPSEIDAWVLSGEHHGLVPPPARGALMASRR